MSNYDSAVTNLGRVLFVDDDSSVLNVIRDTLFQTEFEIITAPSGHEAIELINQEHIDLIISDIRMPEMDGIQLLETVKKKWPSIIRVMLCAYIDESTALQSLTNGLVTTYFPKPWDTAELKDDIIRLLKFHKTFKNEKILNLMNCLERLPSLPMLYQYFMSAFHREATFEEFADIIKQDVTVATKILHIANSAFYRRLGEPTASIEHAIMTMGLNAVKNIVLAVTLSTQKPLTMQQAQHFQNIIDHSSIVNKYIQLFYKIKFLKPINSKFNSVGITHDIGKIILLQYFPERFEKIMQHRDQHPYMTFYDCELDLGYAGNTHTEIGAFLLNLWNLPQISMEVALYHHTVGTDLSKNNDILNISRFTNELVNAVALKKNISDIDYSEFNQIDLPEDDIERIINEIKHDLEEINNDI
ncbi:HDOD domain-containing protein [candidate division KSB1 bacterium]|nr:HDOD domain-containing protein [candidate division KSB1 bacterium]